MVTPSTTLSGQDKWLPDTHARCKPICDGRCCSQMGLRAKSAPLMSNTEKLTATNRSATVIFESTGNASGGHVSGCAWHEPAGSDEQGRHSPALTRDFDSCLSTITIVDTAQPDAVDDRLDSSNAALDDLLNTFGSTSSAKGNDCQASSLSGAGSPSHKGHAPPPTMSQLLMQLSLAQYNNSARTTLLYGMRMPGMRPRLPVHSYLMPCMEDDQEGELHLKTVDQDVLPLSSGFTAEATSEPECSSATQPVRLSPKLVQLTQSASFFFRRRSGPGTEQKTALPLTSAGSSTTASSSHNTKDGRLCKLRRHLLGCFSE